MEVFTIEEDEEMQCMVATVGAKRGMSNLPNLETVSVKHDLENEKDPTESHVNIRSCKICGIAHIQGEQNIVNGSEVQPINKYPWMVRLKFKSGNITDGCGAAILDKYYILTAAHCFSKGKCKSGGDKACRFKPKEVKVGLLTRNPKKLKKGPPVGKIFIHPKYKKTANNDIAIVRLKKPITCNKFASPICLPPNNFSAPDKSMFGVSGWGTQKIQLMEIKVRKLMEGKLVRVKPERCGRETARILCLTGADGSSPCFGDSGGSLFIKKKKAFYTMGVLSKHTGKSCEPNKPVEFTDVSKFLKWIKKKTNLVEAHPVKLSEN